MSHSSRTIYRLNGDHINPDELCDRGKELLRLVLASSDEIKAHESRIQIIRAGREYLLNQLNSIKPTSKRSNSGDPVVQGFASDSIPETTSEELSEMPPSVVDLIPRSLRT